MAQLHAITLKCYFKSVAAKSASAEISWVDRPPSRLRKVFAQHMRTRRRELRISQEELADRCGLHRTYIGSVERAERNISLDNIDRISTALGAPVPEMLQD